MPPGPRRTSIRPASFSCDMMFRMITGLLPTVPASISLVIFSSSLKYSIAISTCTAVVNLVEICIES